MNKRTAFLAFLIAGGMMACNNPFLPPLGPPLEKSGLRESPDGVIKQIIHSYELRRLSQFLIVLDQRNFRFYIAPSAVGTVERLDKNKNETVADSVFLPAGNKIYVYLTYSDERIIHRNLFENSNTISFVVPPIIDSIMYVTVPIRADTQIVYDTVVIDTLCEDTGLSCGESDTLLYPDTVITEEFDTVYAYVRTFESILSVSAPQILGENTMTFDFGKQVFYMRKESDGLWVIEKWFELDF